MSWVVILPFNRLLNAGVRHELELYRRSWKVAQVPPVKQSTTSGRDEMDTKSCARPPPSPSQPSHLRQSRRHILCRTVCISLTILRDPDDDAGRLEGAPLLQPHAQLPLPEAHVELSGLRSRGVREGLLGAHGWPGVPHASSTNHGRQAQKENKAKEGKNTHHCSCNLI